MINGLIKSAGKVSRDLTIVAIAYWLLTWTIGQLTEIINQKAFHEEIVRAEQRSKDLIATEIKNERALSATEHREVMGAISTIDQRTKRIEGNLDILIEKKTAVLSVPARGVN